MKRGAPYCTRAGGIDHVGEVNDMIRRRLVILWEEKEH